MGYRTKPATGSRFDDVAAVLAPKKEGAQGCWCLGVRLGHEQERQLRARHRGEFVERLCRRRGRPPGVLAYDEDGEVVGWAGVAPRSELAEHSRAKRYPDRGQADDWVVYCFRVRAGHGSRGVAHALLAGAVELARAKGAPAVVGYPLDNGGEKADRTLASVGLRSMFDRAGFQAQGHIDGRRAGFPQLAMRLELADG